MSKGIYINSLNTYIGTALYEEFLGDKPEESEWEIYSTYFEKEDSTKPAFIKKMMKQKSKPGLFRKYILEKFDIMIYDMHCGKLEDLKFCIKSLTKAPLETEKTVIMISSVLSWGNTPHKIVEDKPEKNEEEDEKKEEEEKIEEEERKKLEEYLNNSQNIDQEGNQIEVKDDEGNELDKDDMDYLPKLRELKLKIIEAKKKVEDVKEIKMKRVGYDEEEYNLRIPDDSYKEIKQYEDELLNLKYENLTIYVICAGLPYGNAQTIFNYHFKSSWLQSPEDLPYFDLGNNILPTIHVKDLTRIIKQIIEKKPENKYVFACDMTKNKTSKEIVSSISKKIGSGKTMSIPRNETFIKNLNFNIKTDLYIDPSKYQEKKLNLILTENELNWQGFFHLDIFLNQSRLLEAGDFEWYSKDFNKSIKKVLKEFTKYRKLRPLKIVLNCEDNYERCIYSSKLAKFYNIPIINANSILNMLSLDKNSLTDEEILVYDKYFKLIDKLEEFRKNELVDLSDPTLNEDEILFDVLKCILNDNICVNRGYILEGIPETFQDIERLYYQKIEIKSTEAEEAEAEVEVDEEKEEDEIKEKNEEIKGQAENMESNENKENMEEMENNQNEEKEKVDDEKDENIVDNMEEEFEDIPKLTEKQNEEENKEVIENKEVEEDKNNKPINKRQTKKDESSKFIDKQDEIDEELKRIEEERQREEKNKKKPKKKKEKKIKQKQFKRMFLKNLLPESVISIGFRKEQQGKLNKNKMDVSVTNFFSDVEKFYQENKIEVLNLIHCKNQDEMMESMRIYIERNGRPFNYYIENEDDLHKNREKMLIRKYEKSEYQKQEKEREENEIKEKENKEYWDKMEKRIIEIRKDEAEIMNSNDKTRKFLLLNIMPILTKGLLEICKVDPVDPVDYLADYLFMNSTS